MLASSGSTLTPTSILSRPPSQVRDFINTTAQPLRSYLFYIGHLHGMPLSFLLGLGTKIPEFSWIKAALKPERLVYIGLRDLDPGERQILKENKIKAFSMHHVDKYGIGRVVDMALDYVNPARDRPIHLSFDVDALDPSVAPSTGTPVRIRFFFVPGRDSVIAHLHLTYKVRGGLTFREGHYICEAIHETGLLVGLDLMVSWLSGSCQCSI
jgi:arginase